MHLLSCLRRGLLGAAFVASLGFGATQALAVPREASSDDGWCVVSDPGKDAYCRSWCLKSYQVSEGYCTAQGRCTCY